MKRSFSFSEKPILFILRVLPSILPGIEQVIAVYLEEINGTLTTTSLQKTDQKYQLENISMEGLQQKFQETRQSALPYNWLNPKKIGFKISHEENNQIKLFDELNNNVLLLRIRSDVDECNDLFYLFFNQDLSNFGVVNSEKPLSAENKTIIAHLVRNQILTLLKTVKEDRDLFQVLNQSHQALLTELRLNQERFAEADEKIKRSIIQFSSAFLKGISEKHGTGYRLSEDAIVKLKTYNGDMSLLPAILEKAAINAGTIIENHDDDIIVINGFHLSFLLFPEETIRSTRYKAVENPDVPVRYIKTYSYLEKLEDAAQRVKASNKVLTSINVAQSFPKKVTPSAITDALKKHQKKIIHLFTEYPDQWKVIRTEFRPILNILSPREKPYSHTG